ncbi:hypothetical protein D4764_14G0004530 [Takifugu flavidus]|uniref:Uncharacterized protein n=1 Tax=Takifugu flavidus TaxID=433684 RepID=A0A5C6P893_9TELE|nr:hypothetical protein D4764_14G0004530 [Takifugu flavidus]
MIRILCSFGKKLNSLLWLVVLRLVGVIPVVATAPVEFEKLTRRHAVKVLPVAAVFVEEVSYAVGEVVGFESVKSASRMNSVMVIFLDNVYKVQWLVESGVTPVYPLVNPAKKITVFNTPPFIKNDDL